MAFIAKTAFEARITNNEFNDLVNVAGKYFVSTTPTDCSAGLLVVSNGLLDCEGFTGVKNENTHSFVLAESTTTASTPIYACNTYDTKKIDGYYIGTETLGLGVGAGEYGNFTEVNFDGKSVYRFGEGNLDAALSTNTYFTIDDGMLHPQAAAPTTADTPYFVLRGTGNFVQGTSETFGYVDVVACKTVVATV